MTSSDIPEVKFRDLEENQETKIMQYFGRILQELEAQSTEGIVHIMTN